MNAPTLTCKSEAELMRVMKWLEASGLACTATPCDKQISIGVNGGDMPGSTTLAQYKAAPIMLETLKRAREVLAVALAWPNSASIRAQINLAIQQAEKGMP